MPYADSDFFLALMKKDDWLSQKAERILKEHKGKIWTSQWAVVEILMLTKEFGLDPEMVINSISQITRIEGGVDEFLATAHLMKEQGLTTFDALHAVFSRPDAIISSDKIYDKLGIPRIALEK